MNLSEVIFNLLEKENKVTLPEIGTIRLNYYPSEILTFSGKVLPPRYKIEFSKIVADSDNRLIEFITVIHKTNFEEAKNKVNEFCSAILTQIKQEKPFYIPEVGTFKWNKEKNEIIFEEDKNSRLLSENFGLTDVILPSQRQVQSNDNKTLSAEESVKTIKKVKKRPSIVGIGLTIAACILIGSFLITYFYRGQYFIDEKWISSKFENILQIFSNKRNNNSKIHEIKQYNRQALQYKESNKTTVYDTSSALKELQQVKANRLTYYLIAGSFKNRENAEVFLKQLKNKGISAEILVIHDTLFRISIGRYTNRDSAIVNYIQYSQHQADLKVWFYSRYE